MPPKKADPGKKGQQLIDDDYSDLPTLPKINSFFFTTFFSFKYRANLANLQKNLLKLYSFQQEDAQYSKIRLIQKEDIINLAKLKNLLTEEEGNDISKLSCEKYLEVFAKMTNELLLQAEVPLRRNKRDQFQNMSPQEQQTHNEGKVNEVELTVWLKDFPSNCLEFKALMEQGQTLQQVYIVEELFFQDEDEEDSAPLQFQTTDPAILQLQQENEQKWTEKLKVEFPKEERLQGFLALLEINKILKVGTAPDSDLRLSLIERVKFQGPDPPPLPQDSEEQKEPDQEDESFRIFAEEFREKVEKQAVALQEFKILKGKVKTVPLMPYPFDPEEQKREEEERLREEQRKLEEEKKQQELEKQQQQQQQKGRGKPLAQNKSKPDLNPTQTQSQANLQEEQKKREEEANQRQKKKRSRDDEDKDWQTMFLHISKLRSEIHGEYVNIGTIVSSMVYQLEVMNKEQSQGMDFQKPQFFLEQEEEENKLNDHFEDVFNKLVVEHSVKESNFEHKFNDDVVQNALGSSPYQHLYMEKDELSQINNNYTFLNGFSQNKNQAMILNKYLLPGINNRLGMPESATISQAQRESDVAAVLKFSSLSYPQGKRCLILKEFENLFKQNEPERDFNFLDRNFQEVFDGLTLRQELMNAMNLRPQMITKYYDKEDSLLMGIYYKTPAGRLLRKQWTNEQKVFPEFSDYCKYLKGEGVALPSSPLEISSERVGFIRKNIKFCFPSDNSVIRVDKSHVGGKRLGNSSIIKDNLVFGVRERLEEYKEKGGEEESFLNREAWAQTNRNCELWLEFENKTKLLVEMQEHTDIDFDQIPLLEPVPEEDLQKMLDELKNLDIQEEQKKEEEIQKEQEKQQQNQGKTGRDSGMKGSDSKTGLNRKDNQSQQKLQQVNQSDSQKQLETQPEQQEAPKPKVNMDSQAKLLSPFHKQESYQDNWDPTKGSKMTFTYRDGLIVQILPNGDVSQSTIYSPPEKKKYGGTIEMAKQPNLEEESRVITRNSQIIRYFVNGNMDIYYPDGTVTKVERRKGVWETVNPKGIKRVRRVKGNVVYDETKRVTISVREDPETRATISIRQDGVLTINYVDGKQMIFMPDGTQIYREKVGPSNGEITIISKEGTAPVRQINDPVKARARTVIGLGGTDALMGNENIMERTNDGRVSEVLLPDKTIVHSYFERQELEGYNNFASNMVHLVRRDDYSVIKVKQDGEVVLISANQRAHLNNIGKKMELGVSDYDHFFELFGVSNERRSGVYTANLDQGKIWTQDDEGNIFIVYANGDSVEKLSVSFDLDQLVEGIERKEPSSPKLQDGIYVEEECKFLPPPKSMVHPRLFRIHRGVGVEYLNKEQLEYLFRCKQKDPSMINSSSNIRYDSEEAVSHVFLQRKVTQEPQSCLDQNAFPKVPQSVELINQTVSIQKEPPQEVFLMRNIIEFRPMDQHQIADFSNAIQKYHDFRKSQKDQKSKLKIQNVKSQEHRMGECKIWMRIAKERGIKIENLLGDDYNFLKEVHHEETRKEYLDNLDRTFFSDDEDEVKKTENN